MYLSASKAIIMACLLSGCAIDSVYYHYIYMENELDEDVFHCDSYDLPTCDNRIAAGTTVRKIFIARSMSDIGGARSYRWTKIFMCGQKSDIEAVIALSPLVKRSAMEYEVKINKEVYKSLCSAK